MRGAFILMVFIVTFVSMILGIKHIYEFKEAEPVDVVRTLVANKVAPCNVTTESQMKIETNCVVEKWRNSNGKEDETIKVIADEPHNIGYTEIIGKTNPETPFFLILFTLVGACSIIVVILVKIVN